MQEELLRLEGEELSRGEELLRPGGEELSRGEELLRLEGEELSRGEELLRSGGEELELEGGATETWGELHHHAAVSVYKVLVSPSLPQYIDVVC